MHFRPRYTGLIERYRDRLPIHDETRIISLGEGNTPLIRLSNVPRTIGKEVSNYVKEPLINSLKRHLLRCRRAQNAHLHRVNSTFSPVRALHLLA